VLFRSPQNPKTPIDEFLTANVNVKLYSRPTERSGEARPGLPSLIEGNAIPSLKAETAQVPTKTTQVS
jgi:hypothetical protein